MTGSKSQKNVKSMHKINGLSANSSAPPCRLDLLTIFHRDNLGRPLPNGITVLVYDKKRNMAKPCVSKIQQGRSEHKDVLCGDIFWMLAGDDMAPITTADGFVLFKAKKSVQSKWIKSKDPRRQVIDPLCIEISVLKDDSSIDAVYTPPPIIMDLRNYREEDRVQTSGLLHKMKLHHNNTGYNINFTHYPKINYGISHERPNTLSPYQLDQIKSNGNNVTLFIHGYNVKSGEPGSFADDEHWGNMTLNTRPFESIRMQRPWIWQNARDIYKTWFTNFKNNGYRNNQKQYYRSLASASRKRIYKKSEDGSSSRQYEIRLPATGTDDYKEVQETIDEAVNGTAAASWFPLVEYLLNLNAAGKTDVFTQQPDWDNYTRIIGISWSGAAHGPRPFIASEIEANMAARKLVAMIMQLGDKGVDVNIITHSLGARVALGMLNIIGDEQFPNGAHYQKVVKNVFLWQPAVADNAMTNDIKKDIHPLKMGVFPNAHESAQSFTVLFSSQDGVLKWDLEFNDDGEYTGVVGGAYPKKNTVLASGANPLRNYYIDYCKRHKLDAKTLVEDGIRYYGASENKEKYTKDGPHRHQFDHCAYREDQIEYYSSLFTEPGKQEYKKLVQNMAPVENYPSEDTKNTKELDYFAPWAHFYRLTEEMKVAILEELGKIRGNEWYFRASRGVDVRPALGYVGFNNFGPKNKTKRKKNLIGRIKEVPNPDYLNDRFIWDRVKIGPDQQLTESKKIFIPADQSTYYPAHSSLRDIYEINSDGIDFKKIFEKSYQEMIMDTILPSTGFGRY